MQYQSEVAPAAGSRKRTTAKRVTVAMGAGAAKRPAPVSHFRPVPLSPPPAPQWVHSKGAMVQKLDAQRRPVGAPSWDSSLGQDVNLRNYEAYLAAYQLYLTRLEMLKSSFWQSVEHRRGSAAQPYADQQPYDPEVEGEHVDDDVPLDAATLKRQSEKKARKAAARRRQRAAKRERDRKAKAASLETRVEIARLENQLRRANGAKVPQRAAEGKGGEKPVATATGAAETQRADPATQGSSVLPPPGAALKRSNARSRRDERRRGMYLAPGRAPEVQSPTAPHPSG